MAQQVLSFLRNFALCFWLGELLFFASIFAPRVFKVLERQDAANLQASIFPAYYYAGFICSIVVLATLLIQKHSLSKVQYYYGVATAAVGGAVFAFSKWYVTPTLIGLYPEYYSQTPTAEAIETFASLHRISVGTNATVMFLLIGLVFLLSERRQKRVWT